MFKKLSYIIWGVLLSAILLFTSVDIVAFNLNHYKKSFIKYNISEVTNMDNKNIRYIMEDILKYLKDNRTELDTKVVINGKEREVFGNREKLHMIDVKELFVKGRTLRNSSIILFIIMGLFFITGDKHWRKSISNVLLYTAIVNIVFLFILLLLIKTNFDKYFTYFHLIFFNNDLWLLDPNREILIQMLPQGFFYDTVVNIVIYFVFSLLFLGFLGLYFVRKFDKKYLLNKKI